MFCGASVKLVPDALETVNGLHRKIRKERAEKPKARYDSNRGTLAGEATAAKNHNLHQSKNDGEQEKDIRETRRKAKPEPAPMRSDAPESAIPKALRKVEKREHAQADGDAEKEKTPVHVCDAPRYKT